MFESLMLMAIEVCAPTVEAKCVNWMRKCIVREMVLRPDRTMDDWAENCIETMPESVRPRE